MSPKRISVFIFLSLGILLSLTFISRSVNLNSTRTEDGFIVKDVLVKYPTTTSFFDHAAPETNLKADSIITVVGNILPVEDFRPSIPDVSKIDTADILRLVYPGGNQEFISTIKNKLAGGSCRILHFGDSQLEGDRISAYLRNRLQSIYGGSGPGFIPVKQVYQSLSSSVTASDNWLRFAVFDPRQKLLSNKDYGLYASVSRFTAFDCSTIDSTHAETLAVVKATIGIKPSFKSYARLRQYNRIKLHYGNAGYPVNVKIYESGQLIRESSLIADKGYHFLEIQTNGTPEDILIELEGKVSPDFYGLTLDGDKGVSLDNIAMRGSSGTMFGKMNAHGFSRMAAHLDPDIVIMQYGGNTVPYLKDSASIDNYARYLKSNINWVKRFIPGASIVFIGPSDMSTMRNGEMVTYSLLPYLDERLKTTCLNTGVAYWSMFNAMGGKNSMVEWVNRGLAASDYTHFSPKGTRIISELLFTALYLDLKD